MRDETLEQKGDREKYSERPYNYGKKPFRVDIEVIGVDAVERTAVQADNIRLAINKAMQGLSAQPGAVRISAWPAELDSIAYPALALTPAEIRLLVRDVTRGIELSPRTEEILSWVVNQEGTT